MAENTAAVAKRVYGVRRWKQGRERKRDGERERERVDKMDDVCEY